MRSVVKVLLLNKNKTQAVKIKDLLRKSKSRLFIVEAFGSQDQLEGKAAKKDFDVALVEWGMLESEEWLPASLPVILLIDDKQEKRSHFFNEPLFRYAVSKSRMTTDSLSQTIIFALESRESEEALRQSDRKLQALITNTPGIVYRAEAKPPFHFDFLSDKITDILGYLPGDLCGARGGDYSALMAEGGEALRMAAIQKSLEAGEAFLVEYQIRDSKGHLRWISERGTFTMEGGRVSWIDGILFDVTERKNTDEKMNYLAYYDALTGLPNRMLFIDRLNQAIAQAKGSHHLVAVLSLDLDNFKRVNDTLGHAAGDELLKIAGRRVVKNLPDTYTATRLSGDGFVVLLSSIEHSHEAMELADKVSASFKDSFYLSGREIVMSVSMGISIYPDDGEDAESLLKNANTALHRAKDSARASAQLYSSSMSSNALERLGLENSLRRALQHNEFVVHYQPQTDLKTGKTSGVEALVRWNHPELGLIAPMEFIPLAEEIGLVVPINEWVFETACAQLKTWQDQGYHDLKLSLNVSSPQLEEEVLIKQLKDLIKKIGRQAQSVQLELSEHVLMKKPAMISKSLRELKQMGVRIAIDDFGTGYSSLSHLKRFPLDIVKIDRLFVRRLTKKPDDAAIVTAIIAMAHSLNLEVIAEGVETQEQLEILKQYQCDKIQGYLISRPVPAEEFVKLLKKFPSQGRGKGGL